MDTRRTIRKVLIVSMWLVIAAGMITLLAAAMRNQKAERCAGYEITIKGGEKNLFVSEKDVVRIVKTGTKGNIKGQSRSSFDLMKVEKLLEENVWIKDAELYFDNKEVLHVTITEREPIARVFTTTGKTFYIDNERKQMPISDRMSAKVPVFTGFPVNKVVSKRDKRLLQDISTMATFISNDSFWASQVAQVDITAETEFEMVPVVGNHLVKLGKAENIEAKFRRLFIFYKNVLSKTGFDKYKTVDVQYNGQVIGVKGNESGVDSVELRRSVEKLLQQSRDLNYEEMIPPSKVTESNPATTNSGSTGSMATTLNNPSPRAASPQREASPNPVKNSLPDNREPKAVMPKRN